MRERERDRVRESEREGERESEREREIGREAESKRCRKGADNRDILKAKGQIEIVREYDISYIRRI